jgi:hypothetical protein
MADLHILDSYVRASIEVETIFEPGRVKRVRSRRAPVGKLHIKRGSVEVKASRRSCTQGLQIGKAVVSEEPSKITDNVSSGKPSLMGKDTSSH